MDAKSLTKPTRAETVKNLPHGSWILTATTHVSPYIWLLKATDRCHHFSRAAEGYILLLVSWHDFLHVAFRASEDFRIIDSCNLKGGRDWHDTRCHLSPIRLGTVWAQGCVHLSGSNIVQPEQCFIMLGRRNCRVGTLLYPDVCCHSIDTMCCFN
jgi:hypothetical protein